MGNTLLTDQRGSVGIEMVLWSFLLLVFIIVPLCLSAYEFGMCGLMGLKGGQLLDNTLDQMDLGVEKRAICEGRVALNQEGVRAEVAQNLEGFMYQSGETSLKVKAVQVAIKDQANYPSILVDVTWEYPCFTMIGRQLLGSHVVLTSHRIRAIPLDN